MNPLQSITDPDAAVHLTLSAIQALCAGRFPTWWADMWLNSDNAHGADRPWLETLGRDLQKALRGDHRTREDRLRPIAGALAMEAFYGPNRQAAFYFLPIVNDMWERAAAEREFRLPESNKARAFGAALGVIRLAREDARRAGVEPDLDQTDLQAVAEIARRALPSEGISVTDILVALSDHTATIPLAEWLADAPTKH